MRNRSWGVVLKSAVVAAALTLSWPAQVQAGDAPFTYGDYWEVDEVTVTYGEGEAYLTHLAGRWKSSQDFAKQRGFIKDYSVLINAHPRAGEPNLYLVTVYADLPSRAQEERIDAAYDEWMATQPALSDEAKAELARIRSITGSAFLRQVDFKSR